MIGKRFGAYVVLGASSSPTRGSNRYWECQCDCGVVKDVQGCNLKSGASKSCGCVKNQKHGMSRSPEYTTWRAMKRRCYDEGFKSYYYCGARGIEVCDRWKDSFENFFADMGLKPSSRHSLDRINHDKDYGPDNCRWATHEEQRANTRKAFEASK